MSKVLGKDLTLSLVENLTAVVVAGNTDCSIDLSGNTIDATTKDDDDEWEAQIPASKSWSISWNGLIIETSSGSGESTTYSTNADKIIDAFINSSTFTAKFKIGHNVYTGSGLVTSSNFSGAVKDLAKASFTLTGQGALSKV